MKGFKMFEMIGQIAGAIFLLLVVIIPLSLWISYVISEKD